jgi:hypothetical protein
VFVEAVFATQTPQQPNNSLFSAAMSATQDLSSTERYDLATKLITQSPPGQVNDVIAGKVPTTALHLLQTAEADLIVPS